MYKLDLEKAEEPEIKLPVGVGISDDLTCLLRNLYAGQEATVRTGHGTDWSKQGKEYMKAVYCHPAYLTYMQSISCEMPGWMKDKLESDCRKKYQ